MIYASGLMDLEKFEHSLISNMESFALELSDETVTQLGAFYSLLTRWNERLHLVAPCSPEEFAVRHVLESLLLLKHLPQGATVADIGSGGGLPIIPCLIARPDLEVTLIEASQKKAVFLREALKTIGRSAVVLVRPFEEIQPPPVSFVTCRALDRFWQKLRPLIEWAPPGSTLLLFGGQALGEELSGRFEKHLIPLSERRFLFILAAD
jgi:16S rRNA (guanine527-N7)-methyltransferase